MNYQFTFFEEHFQSLQTKTSFAKNYTVESKKNLEREYTRLIRFFKDIAIDLNNREKVKVYFNFHQQNLTLLMDKVSAEISEQGAKTNKKIIVGSLEILLDKMESLINWMREIFPGIFDHKGKVPKRIIYSEESGIKEVLSLILDELQQRCFTKEVLELTSAILDVGQIVSFRDLGFWKSSFREIHRKIIETNSTNEFGLVKIFLENGINHSQLYNHAKLLISKEIENKTTLGEQISSVCLFRKEMRVLFIQDHKLQFENSPDVKRAIKRFLREELLLLRAMEFVNHEVEEAGIMNANYKVSFSVKQLAFFVHLQMETGIIIWQRAKFAHQYIARHFSTVERESISEKSARNAHYNHASEDIKKVIAKLSEMLALAQERY